MRIYPSLLAADLSALKEEITVLSQLPISGLHWDIMDGHFVPNVSFGMDIVNQCRQYTALSFQVHLMVTYPQDYLERCAQAKVDTVFIHQECPTQDPITVLQKIRALGMKAGLVINPRTPLPDLDEMYKHMDALLLMTVEPGFSGQSFLPEVLPKMSQARTRLATPFPICVDGGINPDTLKQCAAEGIHDFVVGHALLRGAHQENRLDELKGRLQTFE